MVPAVLPAVDAAQVLNLETKLAELHPRLLKTSAILDSVLMPHLPLEVRTQPGIASPSPSPMTEHHEPHTLSNHEG